MVIKIKRILKVAIAVKDLDSAIDRWKNLFDIVPFVYGKSVEDKYHWCVSEIGEGDCTLLFLAPLNDPEGTHFIGKYIKNHGEGLYHITLQTADNTDETIRAIGELGITPSFGTRCYRDIPLNASGDTIATQEECYIHPKDANGVAITLATITRKFSGVVQAKAESRFPKESV